MTSSIPSVPILSIDTEYEGPQTLTVQAATRLDQNTVSVQVYYCDSLIPPPPNHNVLLLGLLGQAQDRYNRFLQTIQIRRAKPIDGALSPARVLTDLLDLQGTEIMSRRRGHELWQSAQGQGFPRIGKRCPVKHVDPPPSINLTIVSHFQAADFGRMFGTLFFNELQSAIRGLPALVATCRKRIQIWQKGGPRFRPPILQYIRQAAGLFSLRVDFRDTNLPFGPAKLDDLSRTFLRIPKYEGISEEEKAQMIKLFRERTTDAYTYAVADPLNTLLVHEQMQAIDRQMFLDFGIPVDQIKPMRATQGQRTFAFLTATARESTKAGADSALTSAELKALLAKGGVSQLENSPELSHFGLQHGAVHGGLLYSRSPTRFFHASPGNLCDVDLSLCYNSAIALMNVYLGQPIIYEPGRRNMSLAEAVRLVRKSAPDDGWIVRASGKIKGFLNVLIPSTDQALTSLNFRHKKRRCKRKQANVSAARTEREYDPATRDAGAARIYTQNIEFGVVTIHTWNSLKLLPAHARKQYEQLRVDAIVFFPRKLIAQDAAGYRKLYKQYHSKELPWGQALDLKKMELRERRYLDHDYVSLRYPAGQFARQMAEHRKRAQQEHGRGSGMDKAWKLQANTVYGILASPRMPTQNLVAGNLITAKVRALAFAISQALNAIQTITDGCTYRRDQIPSCTYEECLKRKQNYPILRADVEDGIPFCDPGEVPPDGAEFRAWLLENLARFYQVSADVIVDLFQGHEFEHKKCGQSGGIGFDALCCDGVGNYIKLLQADNGTWTVEEFAARGYGKTSKKAIQDLLVEVYSTDNLTTLVPVTQDRQLLTFFKAGQKARQLLADQADQLHAAVLLPLGWSTEKILNYKIIKMSAFLFQSARQREKTLRHLQSFMDRNGCGLEILALRRTYGDRRQGSLRDLAQVIFDTIATGRDRLDDVLNLYKVSDGILELAANRSQELAARKADAETALRSNMGVSYFDVNRTGIMLTERNIEFVGC
jgi:hypothetical protein